MLNLLLNARHCVVCIIIECKCCSLFYEKEGFYCQPKELPEKEFGGVAVGLEQKVFLKTFVLCFSQNNCLVEHLGLTLAAPFMTRDMIGDGNGHLTDFSRQI